MVQLTRIGIGGVGRTLGTITNKSETVPEVGRPGDIFTRIGVGGVGITFGTITAKEESIVIEATRFNQGMLSAQNVRRSMRRGRGRR